MQQILNKVSFVHQNSLKFFIVGKLNIIVFFTFQTFFAPIFWILSLIHKRHFQISTSLLMSFWVIPNVWGWFFWYYSSYKKHSLTRLWKPTLRFLFYYNSFNNYKWFKQFSVLLWITSIFIEKNLISRLFI